MGNPGASLQATYDMRSAESAIKSAARSGPLQSLTDRELDVRNQPVTVYPHALQRRVKAWVRFGPESIRVDAKLMRSTPLAAGIEFRAGDDRYRCWVWGNAVDMQQHG
ncbi:hypothetical protein [Microbacterium sp. K24]|uniref:hypothetical protein n=1 Tax=Microbacterium sp. K24 TaxID=2305446 RepID=UPI001F113100|nr:hypothetical protein [Microbacterium sp. K24]